MGLECTPRDVWGGIMKEMGGVSAIIKVPKSAGNLFNINKG